MNSIAYREALLELDCICAFVFHDDQCAMEFHQVNVSLNHSQVNGGYRYQRQHREDSATYRISAAGENIAVARGRPHRSITIADVDNPYTNLLLKVLDKYPEVRIEHEL